MCLYSGPGIAFTPSALIADFCLFRSFQACCVLGGGVRVGLSLLVKGSGYRSCPGLVTDRRPSVMRTAPRSSGCHLSIPS